MKRTAITKPLAAALGLPMALIGFAQASPLLPGEPSLEEALDFLHKRSILHHTADSGKGGNGVDLLPLTSILPDPRELLLIELKEAIRDQEDKVEERRMLLLTLARAKDIIPRTDPTIGDQDRLDEDQEAATLLKMQKQIEEDKIELQSYINQVLMYKDISERHLIYDLGYLPHIIHKWRICFPNE